LVAEVGRFCTQKSQAADFAHLKPQAFPGRFFQEGAGPGAAGLVHGIIVGHAVGEKGVFGILSAEFENGIDLRVVEGGGGGVGNDFIDDAWGHGMEAGNLAAGTGHADRLDDNRHTQLIPEGPVDISGGTHRIAVRAQISGGENLLVAAPQQYAFGGGGADVQAEDRMVACFSLAVRPVFVMHQMPEGGERLVEGKIAGVVAEE